MSSDDSMSTVTDDLEARNLLLGQEMVHHTLGRMPVDDFLDTSLPECFEHPDENMPSCNNAFDAIPKPRKNRTFRETSMYRKITEAFNAGETNESKRCPSITFFDTSTQPGPGPFCTKVDVSGYATKHENAGITIPDPSLWQMFWEGKIVDFASDEGNDFLFEHITDQEQKERAIVDFGQMSFYAFQMLNMQFRDFAFSVSMTPHTARLLRWDRSGVIVSRAIDYRRNPRPLCLFLWRFGYATDAQRGIDVSVHKATGEQEALFESLIKKHVILQESLAEDSEAVKDRLDRHYEAGNVFLVDVFDEGSDTGTEELLEPGKMTESKQEASDVFSTAPMPSYPSAAAQEATRKHQFLVSRPVTLPRLLTSRSTKGYWAVDVQRSKVVFLKDCWRFSVPGMTKEGNTLAFLREKGVTTGIPTVICHGDVQPVDASSMVTSSYVDSRWCQEYMVHAPNRCHIMPRVHYRLVSSEVGYTLDESVAGTKELVKSCQSVFDVLCAAEQKAGIIHYDISASNIFLVASDKNTSFGAREAVLINWESAGPEGRNDGHIIKRGRTESAAFRCIASLPSVMGNPGELRHYSHLLVHDIESLVYVALYCGLLRLPWNYSPTASLHWLQGFFSLNTGQVWKMSYVRNTKEARSIWNVVFADLVFNSWIQNAVGLVTEWYPPQITLPAPQTVYDLFHREVRVDPDLCRRDDRVQHRKAISDALESNTCPWTGDRADEIHI
ncbi:uncharacterized protein EV420DRAFT_1636798 [Desarmillaria tabescens]|uniref:Fungal-type protein kinase domain-containing protein n=1 Tax=Armillaria tabescens TaxID=1929756 RepID=A0AA39NIK5_ARMTA|nr:uncharacterized protein EV420DRAFT_1636798 [Desarmillaria tabescens]KAK0466204.1 hypothetical protein EV420DRAFT_1636798 [Desarmillaria tabescens]